MKWVRMGSAVLLMFAFAACESLDEITELEVINQNNPDTERALAEAGDIENLIAGAFLAWHRATQEGYPWSALSTAADETTASWGNFGAQLLSSEPRVAWDNSTAWRYRNHNQRPWYRNYVALSSVYDAFVAIQEDETGELAEAFNVDRARAFGKFVQGLSHGFLAMFFDSAFIFDETVDLATTELEFQPYPTVMAAALGYLDEAIALASGASWSLPTAWILGNPLSAAELVQLMHTHYARQLAWVARTPAERAAVNWASVISHVNQGITEDFNIDGDGADNWWHAGVWYAAQSNSTTWHRADYKTVGFLDEGAGYAAWLAAPVAQRTEFLLDVPDARIMPQNPRDPEGVGLDFQHQGASRFRADRGTYHHSRYMHHRYDDYPNSGGQDPEPHANYNATQLLKAEGLYRTGDKAGAATIVNVSRVGRGGLAPATAGDADLMDKIIYESRIEGFIVVTGEAWFNRRGWGPLAPTGPSHHQGPVQGTALHMPVPGLELEILQKLSYTYGGVGNEGTALAPAAAASVGSSGAGVPARMVYAFNGLDTYKEKLAYMRRGGRAVSAGPVSLIRH